MPGLYSRRAAVPTRSSPSGSSSKGFTRAGSLDQCLRGVLAARRSKVSITALKSPAWVAHACHGHAGCGIDEVYAQQIIGTQLSRLLGTISAETQVADAHSRFRRPSWPGQRCALGVSAHERQSSLIDALRVANGFDGLWCCSLPGASASARLPLKASMLVRVVYLRYQASRRGRLRSAAIARSGSMPVPHRPADQGAGSRRR